MHIQSFYLVSDDITKNPPGLILENEEKIVTSGPPTFGVWDIRHRGVPKVNEIPRFKYVRKEGRLPQDIESFRGLWMLTTKAKNLFEKLDPTAFDFLECETIIGEVHTVGDYWLCDVTRVLDALDENASDAVVKIGSRGKKYDTLSANRLVFKSNIVRNSHVFRMAYNWPQVVCDAEFQKSCKKEKIKNIRFKNAIQ